ncbi:hypothetical protein DMA11_21540 [Marinilabiliaceae bacterium JC017]|nr:hypothetical protein DMA11_21540 [Marinilabiliaceae bacterium JC017]
MFDERIHGKGDLDIEHYKRQFSGLDSLDRVFCYAPYKYEYVAAMWRLSLKKSYDMGSSNANQAWKEYLLKKYLE